MKSDEKRSHRLNYLLKYYLNNDLLNASIHVDHGVIFSSNQAILAAKAGAKYVSPFIGRLDDIGQDGMHLIKEIKTIFSNYNLSNLSHLFI